jgi:predicted GNAT family acetyltransferase
MMLMVLHEGEEEIHKRHATVELDASYSQKIATIMRDVDPEYWGDVTSQRIVEGMNQGMNWLGTKIGQELVSIGSTRLTEWAGLIGVVATNEKHRNKGYATSVVSELVKRILKEVSLAMIFVLADNQPAIQAYTTVGFKPYKTYFFMRGIRR